MNGVSVKVYGKINLSLKVCGIESGYHILDTVMASISVFDVVSVCPRSDGEFTVTFNETSDGANSNAMKAALLFAEAFGGCGADIRITTGIPSGAGLGGSSADAAGVIRALAKLRDVNENDETLVKIAAKVGSDVPYMLFGGYARLVGIASGVSRFAASSGAKILLAGKGAVNTGECFRAFDEGKTAGTRPDNDELIAALTAGNAEKAADNYINELQPYAMALNPGVSEAIAIMKEAGLTACMTGSGSYSFGLGKEIALATAETALKACGFDVIRAVILPRGVEFIG